ncbi:cell division protein ZapA [Novosphingobium sp. SL115]|uniref:cell division protein ZapA n=1 Tax=Novosphingobium sp. SL115 TaxID=2995150 RepID=UPI0022763895|nr:cell division protein ZapA [Novosphingobium sp. SL115]MCY1671701.1 cell division protein ZapA [Novosphingobium sp. SL115]
MSNLNLSIGGRQFVVSCPDGDEAHVEMLGRMVDERAKKIGSGQGEARMLLFAGLMLADELHEVHRHSPTPQAGSAVPVNNERTEAAAARITSLAERLEKLASALEETAANA